jgi:hypothetical protein
MHIDMRSCGGRNHKKREIIHKRELQMNPLLDLSTEKNKPDLRIEGQIFGAGWAMKQH